VDPEKYFENLKVKLVNPVDFDRKKLEDLLDIEFVKSGPHHIICEFYKADYRTGSAFSNIEFDKYGYWKIFVGVADKSSQSPTGIYSALHSYEDIIRHEILHEFWYAAGLGDIHTHTTHDSPRGLGVRDNDAAHLILKKSLTKPLSVHMALHEEIIIKNNDTQGQLVKHPFCPSEIYFVNQGKRAHVDDDKFLSFAWDWRDVTIMSKEKFDALEEVSPIGFKKSFLQQIIDLITKK